MSVALAACLLLAFTPAAGHAATSITYLGKPTSDVPLSPQPPLGHFRKRGPFLRRGGKPEVLFLATMVDNASSAERFPLVKALGWFGTFSGATGTQERSCRVQAPQYALLCDPPGPTKEYPYGYGFATYNLERARYTSPYITLVATDLIDYDLQPALSLSPVEDSFYKHYLANKPDLHPVAGLSPAASLLWHTALGFSLKGKQFPLLSIGGYLQTSVGIALPYDLWTTYPQPFSSIQESLALHRLVATDATGKPEASLIPDVNAEANVITALICHADGSKPKSVCGRAVIKKLLKYAR